MDSADLHSADLDDLVDLALYGLDSTDLGYLEDLALYGLDSAGLDDLAVLYLAGLDSAGFDDSARPSVGVSASLRLFEGRPAECRP